MHVMYFESVQSFAVFGKILVNWKLRLRKTKNIGHAEKLE